MARNGFTLITPAEVALSAATVKTVAQVIAATNVIAAVTGLEITFDGISNTEAPVNVEILRQTTAGTMTSQTPKKTKDTSTALGVTGSYNATAEPTAGDILKVFHIHPQAGVTMPLQLENEIEIPGGGRLGVRVTAPAAVNCLLTITGEE